VVKHCDWAVRTGAAIIELGFKVVGCDGVDRYRSFGGCGGGAGGGLKVRLVTPCVADVVEGMDPQRTERSRPGGRS
jgi:hypothetical protein